jgi:hypothetical protein
MPSFVLHYHECPPNYERKSHWDFMLEVRGALRTWALSALPAGWRAAQLRTQELCFGCAPAATVDEVVAEPLDDHRLEYLEYEGPVSGDRGRVLRIDSGIYATESHTSPCWRLALAGRYLQGIVELRRTGADQSQWTLQYFPGTS